jgi:hypothetical protein
MIFRDAPPRWRRRPPAAALLAVQALAGQHGWLAAAWA